MQKTNKKIEEQIKNGVYYLKYYDKYKKFPFEKKRIDITLSIDVLDKLKGKNKSKYIENLILANV